MKNIIEKIVKGDKKTLRGALVFALVPVMLGIGGCSREAPKKSEFGLTYTYVPYREPCAMWDEDRDGKIDNIREKEYYVAVDTNVIKGDLRFKGDPIFMDSNMVELATKIANLQRELGFKIDSTKYFRGAQ